MLLNQPPMAAACCLPNCFCPQSVVCLYMCVYPPRGYFYLPSSMFVVMELHSVTMGICLVTGGKSQYSGLCVFGAQVVKATISAYAS